MTIFLPKLYFIVGIPRVRHANIIMDTSIRNNQEVSTSSYDQMCT